MADLSNLARLAARNPEFVAYRLAAYQQEKVVLWMISRICASVPFRALTIFRRV